MSEPKWDIFISYASEDRQQVARPLAEELARGGARVWLDENELHVGDSLTERIDSGLSESSFGAVIVSPAFFAKHWPKRELAGLRAREEYAGRIILPVWHDIDKSGVATHSPILADVLAASTADGITNVAKQLLAAIFSNQSTPRSATRRLIELLEPPLDRPLLVSFLRHQLAARIDDHITRVFLEECTFGGAQFDGFIRSVVHHGGTSIAFVHFSNIIEDPYTLLYDSYAQLELASITHSGDGLAAAQQECYELLEQRGMLGQIEHWSAVPSPRDITVGISTVYAGRRPDANASSEERELWRSLRSIVWPSTVRSYDSLVDIFVNYGRRQSD